MRRVLLAALVSFAPACASLSATAQDDGAAAEEQARERDWIDRRVAAGEPVYPRVADVPEVPQDIRSAREFDAAIAEMLAIRDALLNDPSIPPALERQPVDEFERDARDLVRRELERFDLDRD